MKSKRRKILRMHLNKKKSKTESSDTSGPENRMDEAFHLLKNISSRNNNPICWLIMKIDTFLINIRGFISLLHLDRYIDSTISLLGSEWVRAFPLRRYLSHATHCAVNTPSYTRSHTHMHSSMRVQNAFLNTINDIDECDIYIWRTISKKIKTN